MEAKKVETLELFENGEWKGSRELPSLPTIESTDALWPPPPSRHRKLHAADNFARRGRYIGVITIITLLAVFSPWFFAEPYGKPYYIYIYIFSLRVHELVSSAKIFVRSKAWKRYRWVQVSNRGKNEMHAISFLFFNRDRNAASGRFHAIRSFVRAWNVEKSEVNCGCNVRRQR